MSEFTSSQWLIIFLRLLCKQLYSSTAEASTRISMIKKSPKSTSAIALFLHYILYYCSYTDNMINKTDKFPYVAVVYYKLPGDCANVIKLLQS